MLGRVLTIAACLLVFVAEYSLFADGVGSKPLAGGETPAAASAITSTPKEVTSTKATRAEATQEVKKPTPLSTRVLFITEAGSSRCEQELARLNRVGGDFESMRARGWKIGPGPECHIQIVDRTEIPEFVGKLNIREYPTVACVSDGQILRSFKDGCTTPLDSWTFGWLFKGRNERPQAVVSEPARVASTGSYRLRGNHWSVDGDWHPAISTLISHLRSANHAYGLASNWRIETWSYEELRSLHDDLHEREMSSASYSASRSSGPTSLWPKKHCASSKIFGK